MPALSQLTFANPYLLGLLLLLPLLAVGYYWQRHRRFPELRVSTLAPLSGPPTWRARLRWLLPALRLLSLGLLLVALARPQEVLKEEEVSAEGIDIFLAMDLSSSMLARDFPPDRLQVAKRVAADFVDKRPFDRIGLATFAGEAFAKSPLTTDHRVVKEFLASLEVGDLEDGTAIGMGLATAVNRLKDSDAETKVVILLTDGVNNSGYIQPLTAAGIAEEYSIRVYTIGVGSEGFANAPVSRRSNGNYIFGRTRVEIDEALLRELARLTGGRYFRATDEASLAAVYTEIDELEKTEIQVTTYRRASEEFHWFVAAALVLLLLEVGLRYTVFRSGV